MCSNYYSLAVSPTEMAVPEDIFVTVIADDETCGLDGCVRTDDHEHIMFSWDGNGYTESRTWISAEDNSVISLEDAR